MAKNKHQISRSHRDFNCKASSKCKTEWLLVFAIFITSWNNPHVAFQVYCDVEPKRQALAQANLELAAATEKLEAIRKKLAVSADSNTEEVPKTWNPSPP